VSAADCPPIDPGASVDPKVKPYGKKGHYVELYILNSPSTCYAIHGNPVNPNSCHFEGWPNAQRCERYLVKKFGDGVGECPVYNAKTAAWPPFACREDDPHGDSMSCDHFGSADNDKRDDPKTPEFEGSPAVCGQQRDPKGKPEAGFFAIVLGNGSVQACLPGRKVCGAWRAALSWQLSWRTARRTATRASIGAAPATSTSRTSLPSSTKCTVTSSRKPVRWRNWARRSCNCWSRPAQAARTSVRAAGPLAASRSREGLLAIAAVALQARVRVARAGARWRAKFMGSLLKAVAARGCWVDRSVRRSMD
jgi:hypothetical protein